MPNSIGPTGLTTATRAELVDSLTAAMESIYGDDINVGPDTPDGQMINIFVQAVLDNLDLVMQVYNQFDPDNAIGAVLDQRVAINGIQRQAGTYSITNVTITASQALNLFGLEQTDQPVFTVADNAGNQWRLINSQTIGAPGVYVFAFQAAEPGAVLTVPNTITVPVTIVLGVSSINNPTTYTTLGINEESDAALKIRRQVSVSLPSQGFYAGLLAALLNINGVTSAFVYENTTGSTDGNGVPSHSIWVIVAGTAPAADIANAIYTKRNAGCGMKGDVTYVVTQVDGTPFVVRWDTVEAEDLFIKFTATSLDGVNPPNIALILEQLPIIFAPGVNEQVNVNDLATLVQQIDNNTLVTNAGFSTSLGGSYTPVLSPTLKKNFFAVSEANIIITPIILSPAVVTVAALGTQQFTPLGGRAPYTYSMDSNPSGGSVDVNGLYTAGASINVTDVVKVTDALSNVATASVAVVA